MIDLARLMYDPIYSTFGVAAELDVGTPAAAAVTVIDKTVDAKTGQWLELQTVRPVAAVRATELLAAGATFDELDGGQIAFNSKTYRIESHRLKPSPYGEAMGEVYLILTETA
jgi:hypothetical protein